MQSPQPPLSPRLAEHVSIKGREFEQQLWDKRLNQLETLHKDAIRSNAGRSVKLPTRETMDYAGAACDAVPLLIGEIRRLRHISNN